MSVNNNVKEMREIRGKLSSEIMNMSFKQEKEYIKQQFEEIKMQKYNKSYNA